MQARPTQGTVAIRVSYGSICTGGEQCHQWVDYEAVCGSTSVLHFLIVVERERARQARFVGGLHSAPNETGLPAPRADYYVSPSIPPATSPSPGDLGWLVPFRI